MGQILSRDESVKHSSTRDLYGYWNMRRGTRLAPERADIDPTAIPRVLADAFLLGFDSSGGYVFRLAGTRVCALFCRELRGEDFVMLFARSGHADIHDLLGLVCDEAAASVAGLTARLADGAETELELLLLPLSHHGRTDSRVLGALAPIGSPYWLGATPVTSLALGGARHIGPVGQAVAPATPLQNGRVRHGFLVYDGGRP
jgi:hypothetical protein